ncbi:hypothetical protein CcaCcLH18_13393 [Colletotrichum camelliae]|nr:hypothetical protein CcaCcLH18_13393 [Colletotrichum camelliae]
MKFSHLLSLLSFAVAGPLAPVPGNTLFRGSSPLVLRDVAANTSIDCRIWVESSPWATCRSFIDLYKISLSDFVKMNPVVGSDCYDFRPRTQYCLRMVSRFPVSIDGTCGCEMNVTCVGSKFGDCCGASDKYDTNPSRLSIVCDIWAD